MSYDPSTIATLRRALDEVLLDARFHQRKSASALEIAEHLLARAADGERDRRAPEMLGFQEINRRCRALAELDCVAISRLLRAALGDR
ncbi:hypothetical protein ACT4MK_47220 [Bradyrhizobium barranii]|uniref:hypothetical protein n=1 Tax=Bradyrhizobium barranii TaxID=2992140 RepID=UPI004033C7E7